jgi:nucleoside-diphosphate-sugar epimerase
MLKAYRRNCVPAFERNSVALSIAELKDDELPKLKVIPYSSFGKYEDVRRRIPDISRARNILGFEPKVDLNEGLKLTIDWQIQRRPRSRSFQRDP